MRVARVQNRPVISPPEQTDWLKQQSSRPRRNTPNTQPTIKVLKVLKVFRVNNLNYPLDPHLYIGQSSPLYDSASVC